jgi:hypothetical protein
MAMKKTIGQSFEYYQDTPSATWVLEHHMGMYPILDVYVDHNGEKQKILPLAVEYTNANVCTVRFSSPITGRVALT